MANLICQDAKFSKLTVIGFFAKDRSGEKYRCRCECGNECIVYASKLRSSHTKSCGCLKKYGYRPSSIRRDDKFGRLTAIEPLGASRRGTRLWKFICDCGMEHVAGAGPVKYGQIKSCGCLHREFVVKPRLGKHKMIKSPEYRTWGSMLRRCRYGDENPRHGGRGISVCERWADFRNFYEDMGPRPTARHSLDRIDNDGNYEPSNCRWATAKEQAVNRHNSISVVLNGRSVPLTDAAILLGVDYRTLYWRIKHNRPLVKAA